MEDFVVHTITPLFVGVVMITLSIFLGLVCVFIYKEIKNN